jgi:predicted site-specific integrase-resolvase
MSQKSLSEWMRSVEVQERLQVSQKTVKRLGDEGRIGVLDVPGVSRRLYSRADVEALVARAIRPATIQPERRALATA